MKRLKMSGIFFVLLFVAGVASGQRAKATSRVIHANVRVLKTVTIDPPPPITLRTGGIYGDYNSGGWMQFRAKINEEYTYGVVNWTIDGSLTGNSSIGFLTGYEGDYISPAQLPNPPYVNLRAAKGDNPNDYDELIIHLIDIPRSYRLLVDLSHSFLFSWHNATDIFRFGQPFQVTASLQRSLQSKLLENYDAVIIPNAHTDIPFYSYEILALRDFVNRGGGLLMVSENSNGQAPVDAMNHLAKEFGLQFGAPAIAPFILQDNSILQPTPLPVSVSIKNAISVSGTADLEQMAVIVADVTGRAVAITGRVGAGYVAAIGDIDIVAGTKNKEFLTQLTEWLAQNFTAENTGQAVPVDAGCDFRLPIRLNTPVPAVEICVSDSLLGYYPPALNLLVLAQKIPEILEAETKLLGYDYPHKKISVDMITTGGFSFVDAQGTAHAGVPLLKESVDIIATFAHEILGPWHYPKTVVQPIGEGSSMWHSEETLIQMGGEYAIRGWDLRQWHLGNFYNDDPTGTQFDIAKDFLTNTPVAFGKVHWIFNILRFYLGNEFFRKYWKTIQDPKNDIGSEWAFSIDDFIYWMSVANKINLFPFFKEIGTTIHPEIFPALPFLNLN